MKKQFGDYFLGLDIGTDSLGWAVTDLNYNVYKFNGKALWGVRLFDGGKTAEERRLHRSARRRQQRKVQRMRLLQELFAAEISKVDQGFYQRLADSKFYEEDKNEKQPYTLFSDSKYTDKEYHKDFPTIFHLRKALIENKKTYDVRFVYLAINHIIKNRGHFLFEGQKIESVTSFSEVFNGLKEYLLSEFDIDFECQSIDEVGKILKDKKIGINEKKRLLAKYFTVDTKQKKAIISFLVGGTEKLSNVFEESSLDESEVSKFSFADSNYEENKEKISDLLGEKFYCIEKMKSIFDWTVLSDILKDEKYISYAKVATYDKHKYDLNVLKKVVRKYKSDYYDGVFEEVGKETNYCAYIGMTKKNGRKLVVDKRCCQEEFCKYVEKLLVDIDIEDDDLDYIKIEANNRTLLPKQITKNNGVIPYQLNLAELKMILENTSEYLAFINEKDNNGLSVKDKIIKLFMFRIPYYVGPLNDAHKVKESKQCWIQKRTKERVLPWNFEEVVDIEASAENFITKMTNKCSYLIGADVLPKNSLLYSKFMLLNELNNIKVNGTEISVEIKQKIYSELFLKTTSNKKVTEKRLKDYLLCEGIMEKEDELSGIDGEIKSNLNSYKDFKIILKDKFSNKEMVEDIIRWIVLFGEDKKLLDKKIKTVYGSYLNDNEIKMVSNLKYTGWGRLSKEFLNEIIHVDKSTGECINIISALWETNNNLMQLLSNNYDYLTEIEKYNKEQMGQITEITYDIVDKLYVSPSVKRQIWQTLTVVKEVSKVMGHQPKKVFVEMARGEEEKKRTESRKTKLLELYKNCKEESRDWQKEIDSKSESELRSKRLYLYYTQMGRCMYSGEKIELRDLFNENIYDLDHIYPRSKVKDDSLENMVLVKKSINASKSDIYPISCGIRNKNKAFWKSLNDKGLIGNVKYSRLTRTTEFSDDELAGFIARQLVEARQSTKAVASILKQVFEESEIVYVKAGNVSEFRQIYKLHKVREINDYHHAKDAYLNIVVGNVYNTKFTSNPIYFIKNPKRPKYNLKRIYEFEVKDSKGIAWLPGKDGTILLIKKTMKKNNILFTRYSFEQKGAISDQNIVKKGKGQLPIKSSDDRLKDIAKYGGYNKVSGAYYMLVEHTLKKKRICSFEVVPIHLKSIIEHSDEERINYCINDLKLNDPIIKIKKVKINSLFNADGFYMHLSGRTSNQLIFKGANQLCLPEDAEVYIKKVIKYINRVKASNITINIIESDNITKEENIKIYNLLMHKLKNTVYKVKLSSQADFLEKNKESFEKLSIEEQCKLLNQILCLFQCNSLSANFSVLNGGKSSGIIKISKNISEKSSLKLINQSASGIFEKEIDLSKI